MWHASATILSATIIWANANVVQAKDVGSAHAIFIKFDNASGFGQRYVSA
jgi:hypothetical protein